MATTYDLTESGTYKVRAIADGYEASEFSNDISYGTSLVYRYKKLATAEDLNTEIETRAELYNDLEEQIAQEIEDRGQAISSSESAINTKLNSNVINSVSLSYNVDTVTINKGFKNLSTGGTTSSTETIQLANQTTAGLMSSSDVKSLSDLSSRVEKLEGTTVRLIYTSSTNPSKEQINQFVTAAGYTSPFSGIAVVISDTYHIWHYYTNTDSQGQVIGWRDDGQDTVSQFTNTTSGVILGSQTDGKVYAESDGTGSVYGWSTLKESVSNNNELILQEVQDRGNAILEVTGTISDHINDKDNPHEVTKSQVGLSNVANERQYSSNNPPPYPVTSVNGSTGAVSLDKSDIGLSNVDNIKQYSSSNPPPYPVTSVNSKTGAVSLTKSDLSLGNVENERQYSASNPPPYPVTSVSGKTGSVTLVKGDVGLGNVDNTSDANKPISTATQTALNGKQATLVSGTNIKTINNSTILGNGNLSIPDGDVKSTSNNTFSGTNTFNGEVSLSNKLSISGLLSDVNGLNGQDGQVLTSTGTGVEWKTIESGGGATESAFSITNVDKDDTEHTIEVTIQRGAGSSTNVEANPTSSATESLNKIKIGNTVYTVVGSSDNNSYEIPDTSSLTIPSSTSGVQTNLSIGDGLEVSGNTLKTTGYRITEVEITDDSINITIV